MKSFPPTAVAQFRAASFAMRTFGLLELDELFPLAASVLLLAYIEGRFRSVLAKVHVPDIKIVVCGSRRRPLSISRAQNGARSPWRTLYHAASLSRSSAAAGR